MNTMAVNFIKFLLITILLSSCTGKNFGSDNIKSDSGRVSFEIKAGKIMIPVQFNDSINVNLLFDTGGSFFLDSAVCNRYPVLTQNNPDTIITTTTTLPLQGQGISEDVIAYKNSSQTGKIGDTDIQFENLRVQNWWARQMGLGDGMFNIPEKDSVHVWELNFDDNYLKIHHADSFIIPENCYVLPLARAGMNRFFTDLPLRTYFKDDSLILNHRFVIDTGADFDIVLARPTKEETEFLYRRKDDAVFSRFAINDYCVSYTADAVLFNSFSVDSLRLYTFGDPRTVDAYLCGLNFLKRFNVFFDLKNMRLMLQPVKNFKRIVFPEVKRFHFSVRVTEDRKGYVKKVADYKKNYFKTAGLQEGDEIVKVNDMLFKNLSNMDYIQMDTVRLDIIRAGKPVKLIIPVDKNEEQGE